jgi:predicted permease
MGAKLKTKNDERQTKNEFILNLCTPALISQKINRMEQVKKKSSAIYWILFFISVAACVLMYFSPFANYITATLPFICYYFVKAMDLI